jgi:predicted ArsR family transcriptional regulator
MTSSQKTGVIIDKEIPLERQIEYLRKAVFSRDAAAYKVLTEQLGEERGKELYWAIRECMMLQRMAGGREMKVDFTQIKQNVGVPDKMLGFRVERDHETEDEVLMSFLNCPPLEIAKQYGLEKEVCKYLCERETEQVRKIGCEMTILSRIADGAVRCRFRIKPTD